MRAHDGRIVAVGRVVLHGETNGAIDFAACASVVTPPGDYQLHLPKRMALAKIRPGRPRAARLLLPIESAAAIEA